MECPNCTFQNVPGTRECVRCQSLLDLSDVVVAPPRAGGLAGVRRAVALAGIRARDGLSDMQVSVSTSRLMPFEEIPWRAIGRSVVPGLGQLSIGQPMLGFSLLAGWIILVLLAITAYGTGAAWLFASLAISVHCTSISMLMAGSLRRESIPMRLVIGLGMYAALVLCVYGPVYWCARSTARVVPVQGVRDHAAIADGDVVLITSRWTRPETFQRGEVVAYHIERIAIAGAIAREGMGMDRVIGVPGDVVEIAPGELKVNGVDVPPEMWPLGGLVHVPRMAMTAAENEYIVFPSALRWNYGPGIERFVAEIIPRASKVPADRVMGRVICRVRPLSRMGRV